jgi:hypothetical protein
VSQLARGVVSRIAAIGTPALRYCQAISQSSGPQPAITTRPSGTRPDAFSAVCAPPQLITPGSVQPGIGKGRSSAPVASITSRATMMRERPAIETPIS